MRSVIKSTTNRRVFATRQDRAVDVIGHDKRSHWMLQRASFAARAYEARYGGRRGMQRHATSKDCMARTRLHRSPMQCATPGWCGA